MNYLLDTCVISELVKPAPNRKVIDWLNELPSGVLFLCAITIGEVRKGLTKLPDSKKKERLTLWLNTLLIEYNERILLIDLKIHIEFRATKGSLKNNFTFSHPIFRPYLPDPQSQSPRNRPAIPVGLQFRIEQIRPKPGREFCDVILE